MVQDTGQWFVMDAVRGIFAEIDKLLYSLISWLYEIFFNVANAQLLSGSVIKDLFSRVQLILGIIIMFKVAMSLFNGIMNPDSLRNEKTGVSSMIKRVIMVLIMLMLLVPLNIPTNDLTSTTDGSNNQGTWNKRMNDNGILFGTLYELQSRLLNQNTIARLILGAENVSFSDVSDSSSTYKDAANELATIVLRCFVTINLSEEPTADNPDPPLMCPDDKWDSYYTKYNDSDSTVSDILGDINEWCYRSNSNLDDGKDHYIFNYKFLLSSVAAVLFAVILISFTVDVAIRLFKLAILQLIAPIPILSYIDPKSQNTFQTWVKTVGITYAMLFVRLAIMYFVIFLMMEFGRGDLLDAAVGGRGAVWLFSKLFVYLGLLMFAKEAPKFILDSLGIKSEGKGLFSGLHTLNNHANRALATTQAGISSFLSRRRASLAATDANKGDKDTHPRLNRAKAMVAGIAGGVGAIRDVNRDFNSDPNKFNRRNTLDKINRANAMNQANAEAGSTWWGRKTTQWKQDWGGDTKFDKNSRQLESDKDKLEAAKERQQLLNSNKSKIEAIDKKATDEVTKKGAAFDLSGTSYKDKYGVDVNGIRSDLKSIALAMEHAKTTGIYEFDGHVWDPSTFSKMYADAVDNAKDSLYAGTGLPQSEEMKAMISDLKVSIPDIDLSEGLRIGMKGAKDSIGAAEVNINAEISQLNRSITDLSRVIKKDKANLRGNDGSRGGS